MVTQLDPESKTGSPGDSRGILEVVHKRHLLPMVLFIGLTLWAIGVMIFEKVPVTVTGNTIFLYPETVIPFQSTAGGQIGKWLVHVGDVVKKGQLLATLDQPLIDRLLKQAKEKLADIETRNKAVESYMRTYIKLEKEAIANKIAMMKERTAVLREQVARSRKIMETSYARKIEYMDQNEKDLKLVYNLNLKRGSELGEKLASTEKLRKEQLASDDQTLAARQETIGQIDRIASVELQVLQTTHDRIKATEAYLDAHNRLAEQETSIQDLDQQMEELISQDAQLDEQLLTFEYTTKLEENELRRNIDRAQKELVDNREVRSDYDGRILELTAGEGKRVTKGIQLGTIQARDKPKKLEAISYFKLADGKKIKPGMRLRITPATVERERSGSIIASVRSVSSFPVTTEGVVKIVGNTGVAAYLTKDDRQIEVFAELEKDESSPSGYKWDSSLGPEIPVTSGTIASALVNIQEKPLITFVIPILGD
jgi:HlyD family secretion protein